MLIEQPPIRGGVNAGYKQFHRGGPKSVARLRNLNFDPIGDLVKQHGKITAEIEHQEKMRSGEIIELTPAGKSRAYRPEIHHALYDKLLVIGKELLRYGYGRVPEQVNENVVAPQPLIVNLTKKGDVYMVNPQADIDDVD